MKPEDADRLKYLSRQSWSNAVAWMELRGARPLTRCDYCKTEPTQRELDKNCRNCGAPLPRGGDRAIMWKGSYGSFGA